MVFLDEIVCSVNKEIEKGISSISSSINGIVRKTFRDGSPINYDAKESPVVYDNTKNIFIYHRQIRRGFEQIQSKGKKYLYKVTAEMELICFTKNRKSEDYLIEKLSENRDIEIKGVELDSLRIFKDETGIEIPPPDEYIFKIIYDLKYHSTHCTDCLND